LSIFLCVESSLEKNCHLTTLFNAIQFYDFIVYGQQNIRIFSVLVLNARVKKARYNFVPYELLRMKLTVLPQSCLKAKNVFDGQAVPLREVHLTRFAGQQKSRSCAT